MARSETILLFVRSQWSIISPNSTSASCSFCMVEHDASDDDNYSVRSLTSEPPSPGVGPGLCQCPGGACCSAEHIKRLVEDALGSGQGPVFIGCSFTVINGDIFNGPISHANVGGYKNNNLHNVTQLNSQVSTIPVPRLNHFARTVANFMRG
ncbi:hypothetical protein BDN71DRAFT_1216481 [Pleurotus eryngii]|uniref:Uncharacterized protein n=1 Tax=Pleurotus eryngii TaxID=5323 RepID=A0A9P6D5W4_PLEER|nr:hypothetical protein BDN71DRAFT_1216481 [Pleurotus eryngii]